MPTVYVPKVYDTNIQKNYNLPNVNLNINGVSVSSNDTTFTMSNTADTFTIIAEKQHYISFARNGCAVVREYECSICGAPVHGDEGALCPNCGEPLTTAGKTPKLQVSAGEIGAIVMQRESDVCMTEKDFNESVISGTSTNQNLINPNQQVANKLLVNKTYIREPNNFISTYLSDKITSAVTSSTKQAFVFERDFKPIAIPEDYDDYKYIRVISGKTHNITSSAQTINSVIRTNIPLPYNFVSASSVNWITGVRYFEDLHDPNFSLIKVTADVSENNSLTDDRSGIITISNSTYGVSGVITVNQSAKTVSDMFKWVINNDTAYTQNNVDGTGDEFTFGVNSVYNGQNNAPFSVTGTVPYNVTTTIQNNNTLIVNVGENQTISAKTGTIRLKQNGSNSIINLTINQNVDEEIIQEATTAEGFITGKPGYASATYYIKTYVNADSEEFNGANGEEMPAEQGFAILIPRDGYFRIDCNDPVNQNIYVDGNYVGSVNDNVRHLYEGGSIDVGSH